MASLFNVHCMLCGRHSGHLRNGTFRPLQGAPPLAVRAGKSRCGYCGGSLYLEAEDSPFARDMGSYARAAAAQTTSQRTRRAS